MLPSSQVVTLRDGGEAKAVVAPELGGWLLRYIRHLPEHGYVDALYYAQEIVDRYPNQMYAGNPILFPMVSFNHLPGQEHHYAWRDEVRALPQHGFARRSKWKVAKVRDRSVTLELTATDETRKAYPFSFRHQIAYELAEHRLVFSQRVENTSKKVMPFSTGIHPYFPVPILQRGSRNECYLEIPECRKVIDHGGWQSWTAEAFGPAKLSAGDDFSGTMFLTDLRSPEISLIDPEAKLRIRLNFAEAPKHRFVALWSKSQDAPFLCIEPWTALPNSFSRPDSELILLESGEEFEARMWFAIEPLV